GLPDAEAAPPGDSKALRLIEADRSVIAGVDAEHQPSRSALHGTRTCTLQQRRAQPQALETMQQVDALDLGIALSEIGQRQLGGAGRAHDQIPDGRTALLRLGEPGVDVRGGEPAAVELARVLVRAVLEDVGTAQRAGEGLQETRLPEQRERRLIARAASPDDAGGSRGRRAAHGLAGPVGAVEARPSSAGPGGGSVPGCRLLV